MTRNLIAQGAEARVYVEGKSTKKIVKERFAKGYRISIIDERLRKTRTRVESRILEKLKKISFPCPALVSCDDENGIVEMEFLSGNKVRDVLKNSDYKKICKEIGRLVAKLHENNIIHGDLTTSNMIYSPEKKVFFIDFGLSFISHKVEDRAVDLHLLRQALESKHYKIWEECFKQVILGYKDCENSKEVLQRLYKVEERGRHKAKY